MIGAALRGGLGFAAVSLLAFSVWAFGGRRLSGWVGEKGMYAAVAAAFVVAAGPFLMGLLPGPRRLFRTYVAFVPAFLAYSAVWCAAWFALGFGWGEWLGSLAGSIAFAAVAGVLLGNPGACSWVWIPLFVAHSIGYFGGGAFYYPLKKEHPVTAMLGWGLIYGLGFGVGIGCAFRAFTSRKGAAPGGGA